MFGAGEIGYAVRAIFMRLRDLVVLDPEERQRRLAEPFASEHQRFSSSSRRSADCPT